LCEVDLVAHSPIKLCWCHLIFFSVCVNKRKLSNFQYNKKLHKMTKRNSFLTFLLLKIQYWGSWIWSVTSVVVEGAGNVTFLNLYGWFCSVRFHVTPWICVRFLSNDVPITRGFNHNHYMLETEVVGEDARGSGLSKVSIKKQVKTISHCWSLHDIYIHQCPILPLKKRDLCCPYRKGLISWIMRNFFLIT